MLGHKPRVFKLHSEVCLDDWVPQDNFYRQVEGCLDLDFIRDLVCDLGLFAYPPKFPNRLILHEKRTSKTERVFIGA